jgi:hypothetical protein
MWGDVVDVTGERDVAMQRALEGISSRALDDRAYVVAHEGEPLAVLSAEPRGWALRFRFASCGQLLARLPAAVPADSEDAQRWAEEEVAALLAEHWLLGEERPQRFALAAAGAAVPAGV